MKELSSTSEESFAGDEVRERSARIAALAGPGVEERFMDLDGLRMRYLRAGSGPPLILLHGLIGYSFSWRFVMPALAPYATVYAPDMLGAGFSERSPSIDHSMAAIAATVLQFIEQLRISSFDLLGTSHGGAVAMNIAAQVLQGKSPAKLRRLILVAPANPFSAHGRRLAPLIGSGFGSALFRGTFARSRLFFRLGHRRLYARASYIPADALEGYRAPLSFPRFFDHALSIVHHWSDDMRHLESILPQLAAANIPTLFLWGSKDAAVYASSAEPLARYFPNSQTVIFPGIGHLAYEECPDEFNRAVIEFLTQ